MIKPRGGYFVVIRQQTTWLGLSCNRWVVDLVFNPKKPKKKLI
jgi:hypothetical protein